MRDLPFDVDVDAEELPCDEEEEEFVGEA